MKVKHNYYDDVFIKEDSVSYYLLGVMLSDGCISFNKSNKRYCMSISSKDYDWIYEIATKLCDNPHIIKHGNSWEINNTHYPFINWLLKNGCVQNKSLILKFPENIPEKYMFDFIRGMIDGDGSICFSKSSYKRKDGKESEGKVISVYLCSSSINFVNDFKLWLDKYNLKYNTSMQESGKEGVLSNGRIIKSKNNHYRITIQRKEAYKLLKLIYYNDNIFAMNRKKEIANKIFNYYDEKSRNGKGENNTMAKLTNEQVKLIKNLWNSGKFLKKINLIKYIKNNLKYNVCSATIYNVLSNNTFVGIN